MSKYIKCINTHSDVTATLLPLGSIAILRTLTPASEVRMPSNCVESLAYWRTSVSSLPENQQSSYEILRSAKECDIVENIMWHIGLLQLQHMSPHHLTLQPSRVLGLRLRSLSICGRYSLVHQWMRVWRHKIVSNCLQWGSWSPRTLHPLRMSNTCAPCHGMSLL